MNIPEELSGSALDCMNKLRSQVTVDCGHTPVTYADGKFLFGRTGQPSLAEVQTLRLGIAAANFLRATGRKSGISVCFSDSTRNLGDALKRTELRDAIEQEKIFELLPQSYRELISSSQLTREDFQFSLQTRNSNVLSGWMKNLKKQILALGCHPDAVYREFHALFLKDKEGDLFGFTTPMLFNTSMEDKALNTSAWHDELYEPSERDLQKAPLLSLKQMKVINLHSKASGILCPGTYGGLLLGARDPGDHIAIYFRNDDAFIGEKILRGVVSANIMNPGFDRNCLQIIFPRFRDSPEVSLISRAEIFQSLDLSFDSFSQVFERSMLPSQYRSYA